MWQLGAGMSKGQYRKRLVKAMKEIYRAVQ